MFKENYHEKNYPISPYEYLRYNNIKLYYKYLWKCQNPTIDEMSAIVTADMCKKAIGLGQKVLGSFALDNHDYRYIINKNHALIGVVASDEEKPVSTSNHDIPGEYEITQSSDNLLVATYPINLIRLDSPKVISPIPAFVDEAQKKFTDGFQVTAYVHDSSTVFCRAFKPNP